MTESIKIPYYVPYTTFLFSFLCCLCEIETNLAPLWLLVERELFHLPWRPTIENPRWLKMKTHLLILIICRGLVSQDRLPISPIHDTVTTPQPSPLQHEDFSSLSPTSCSKSPTRVLYPCRKSSVVKRYHHKQQQYEQSWILSFGIEAANSYNMSSIHESYFKIQKYSIYTR